MYVLHSGMKTFPEQNGETILNVPFAHVRKEPLLAHRLQSDIIIHILGYGYRSSITQFIEIKCHFIRHIY